MLCEVKEKDVRELIQMLFNSLKQCCRENFNQKQQCTITYGNSRIELELHILISFWLKIRHGERVYMSDVNKSTGEVKEICFYDINKYKFEYKIDPNLPYTDFFGSYKEQKDFEKIMINVLYRYLSDMYTKLKRENPDHCIITLDVSYSKEQLHKFFVEHNISH